MISKPSLLFLVLLFIGLFNYYPRVDGFFSKEEVVSRENDDLELERQLKFLNKHPIKTINHVENGDTFDCIDIHKQPALDHPLLKNHKIQMRPNSRSKGLDGDKKFFQLRQKSKYSREGSTAFKPLGCPEGTVPIRRTTKEDLIRAKPFFESYTPSHTSTPQTNNDGQHVAIRRSKSNNETYYGVFGWIDLANPSFVQNDQFSAAQLWVEGGPLDKITTLQAGWAVSPQLFQDNKTRLFGYSNSDINPQGCYNLLCQGFVQTNNDIAFGLEFTSSTYGGEQRILVAQIYKENDSGSWWLGIGASVHDIKDIGYWPGEIYSELVEGASYVAWGGMVKANPKGQSPDMGNGYSPHGSSPQYRTVCSVMQLQVIYSNFTFVPPNESAFENFVDSKICYGLEYSGNLEKIGLGYSFMFGGPGGNNCGN